MPTSDRRWDRLAEEREFTQLDDLRAASEQWRNGIGALTGALGTASVLKGTETFKDLPGAWRYAAVGLAILGLVLLAVATGFAMRAAFKQPRQLLNSGEDLRRWVEKEAVATYGALRVSKRITVPAVAALATTLVLSWAITPADGSSTNVQLRKHDGSRVCAQLKRADENGVTLAIGDAKESTPWTDISELEPKCADSD